MNLDNKKILTFIAMLKENGIEVFNEKKLINLINELSQYPKFTDYLNKIPEKLDNYMKVFEKFGYIEKKENELNAYRIMMDSNTAKKAIEAFGKDEKNLELAESFCNLYIDKDNSFTDLFDKVKPVKDQHIGSMEEFLYLFFACLVNNGISYLDEDIFKETFGFSFYDTDKMYEMTEAAFGRPWIIRNVRDIFQLFLIDDPLVKSDKFNNSVLLRTGNKGLTFMMNPKLYYCREKVSQLEKHDEDILYELTKQYIRTKLERSSKLS